MCLHPKVPTLGLESIQHEPHTACLDRWLGAGRAEEEKYRTNRLSHLIGAGRACSLNRERAPARKECRLCGGRNEKSIN